MTAFAMTGDKEKALEAGCDEYISKPVKSDLLLSVINKLIN
jgi:CheY-like chemotaxis protein